MNSDKHRTFKGLHRFVFDKYIIANILAGIPQIAGNVPNARMFTRVSGFGAFICGSGDMRKRRAPNGHMLRTDRGRTCHRSRSNRSSAKKGLAKEGAGCFRKIHRDVAENLNKGR